MGTLASIMQVVGEVTGVLPLVSTIISGIEVLFGGGNGASKLAAATSAAVSALQIYSEASGKTAPASLQADLAAAISANVKVMNDLGLLLPHGSPSLVRPAAAKPA